MTTIDIEVHDHQRVVTRARRLNALTIVWNAVEGVVAVAAGAMAGSLSLIGFGLDSGIEVSAALVLTWRLDHERRGPVGRQVERRAQQAIAACFAALAAYVLTTSALNLAAGNQPDASTAGLVIAGLSLLVMPVLARAKRRVATQLASEAARAEAAQTDLCTMLSAALLVGLGANALWGWWWADSAVALLIGVSAAWMAVRTWRSDGLADTCCG